MCDYIGHEFGAWYPDSFCNDGYLYDADACDDKGNCDGGDLPCPQCNVTAWRSYYIDEIEERGWIAASDGKPIAELEKFKFRESLPLSKTTIRIMQRAWRKGWRAYRKENPTA